MKKTTSLALASTILLSIFTMPVYAKSSDTYSISKQNVTKSVAYVGDSQLDATFPSLASSSATINNSTKSFKGYEDQGTIHLTLKNVKNASIYINNKKVDLTRHFGKAVQYVEIDISNITNNGDNTIQITNISSINDLDATIDVNIPYPILMQGKPSDVGLNDEVFDLIDMIIEKEIEAKGIPGGQLLIAKDGKIIKNDVYGYVKMFDENGEVKDKTKVRHDTLYDLASNTKMYAANYAIQKLVSEGKLNIDAKLTDIFADFDKYDPMKKDLTVKHLLTHSGGFIPDPQYHNQAYLHTVKIDEKDVNLLDKNNDNKNDVFTQNPDELLEMIKKTPLEYVPGSKNVYSDVDYILLGMIVEKISNKDLETYVNDEIFSPLGLESTMYNPLEKGFNKENIAATEMQGNTRQGNISFDNIRTTVVQGEVHDEKAFYSMGGVSGHAGLFSNSADIAQLMQIMINGGGYGNAKLFDQHTIDKFVSPSYTNDTYSLGWRRQGNDGYTWTFGANSPDSTIGHTGWTGTATQIDLDNDMILIWFTNTKNTPIANTDKSLHRMSGDAFQSDALGTISTLVYQGLNPITKEQLNEIILQITLDRINFLNSSIEKDSNNSNADYAAANALLNVLEDYTKNDSMVEQAKNILPVLETAN